jgi:hypothetical protein
MTERLGECWECDAQDVPVFSEGDGFGRDYCAKCIQRCVFCKGYCDSYGCANDEGEINFDVHDCLVDGKVTCLDIGIVSTALRNAPVAISILSLRGQANATIVRKSYVNLLTSQCDVNSVRCSMLDRILVYILIASR